MGVAVGVGDATDVDSGVAPCSAWKCEATNTKAEPTKISTGKRRFTGRALHVNLSRPIANLPAKDCTMPEEDAVERAREDEREGKSPSTQAGEFVREEMEHIRAGEHGARSPEQAIAIGLSKARRAGVELPPPKRGSRKTKRQARRDLAKGRRGRKRPSRTRSRATKRALRREGRSAASRRSLSRQARKMARRRGPAARSRAAKKAARTRKQKR